MDAPFGDTEVNFVCLVVIWKSFIFNSVEFMFLYRIKRRAQLKFLFVYYFNSFFSIASKQVFVNVDFNLNINMFIYTGSNERFLG